MISSEQMNAFGSHDETQTIERIRASVNHVSQNVEHILIGVKLYLFKQCLKFVETSVDVRDDICTHIVCALSLRLFEVVGEEFYYTRNFEDSQC